VLKLPILDTRQKVKYEPNKFVSPHKYNLYIFQFINQMVFRFIG